MHFGVENPYSQMAKGDIDKSDANGSQKQEKTKTGKDDKNPMPSTAKRNGSVNGTNTRKKAPASLSAPPKNSKQLDELSALFYCIVYIQCHAPLTLFSSFFVPLQMIYGETSDRLAQTRSVYGSSDWNHKQQRSYRKLTQTPTASEKVQ